MTMMQTPAAMKSNQILIPIDVAQSVLKVLHATTPRGNAHAEELLRLYHSLSNAVMQTRNNS